MEFTPNSCSSKCPRTPIYRMGVRMGVRQNYAWEPSGRWTMAVRTDNCATGFSKIFAEKPFLYKNIVRTGWLDRLDGRTFAASNFHNRLLASGRLNFNTQFPYLMRVSPDHEGESSGRLKLNRQLPYTMHQRPDHNCQTSGRFILNCDSCLTEIRVRTDTTSSGRLIDLPFLEVGKNQ
jgi:hypothetical protein